MNFRLSARIVCLVCMIGLGAVFTPVFAAVDTVRLANQISDSLGGIPRIRYKTVAFSHISGSFDKATLNELIDFINVAVVRKKRFKVIDRTKLRIIIKEQLNNTSLLISPREYRQLGKVLGVDLFLYGKIYNNVLIVKAIDVETSAIVWSNLFNMDSPENHPNYPYRHIPNVVVESLRKNIDAIQKSGIKKISFWTFTGTLNSRKLIDYMSSIIASENTLQVVDRENLDIILEEQKLSMGSVIDQQQAKKIGELYGIDAFVYGNIIKKDHRYIASLKLMNILSGVIEWADLFIFSVTPPVQKKNSPTKKTNSKPGGRTGMISIPDGIAIIGNASPTDTAFPVFQKRIQSFFIDKYEVTYSEYAKFVRTYNYRFPKNWHGQTPSAKEKSLPVVYVTWEDAARYCDVNGKRLPTEYEWEYAYRGKMGNQYPWGMNIKNYRVNWSNNAENKKYGSMAVTRPGKDISVFGVRGMAGNVREWTADDYQPYPGNTIDDQNYRTGKSVRGGSWAKSIQSSPGWKRGFSNSILAWPDVGFRCAADRHE